MSGCLVSVSNEVIAQELTDLRKVLQVSYNSVLGQGTLICRILSCVWYVYDTAIVHAR